MPAENGYACRSFFFFLTPTVELVLCIETFLLLIVLGLTTEVE